MTLHCSNKKQTKSFSVDVFLKVFLHTSFTFAFTVVVFHCLIVHSPL